MMLELPGLPEVKTFLSTFRQKQERLVDLRRIVGNEKFFAAGSREEFIDGLVIEIPAKLVCEYAQIEAVQLERELAELDAKFQNILKAIK